MQDHSSIHLARTLYKSHKEAIDFIIENRPDDLDRIRALVEHVIESEGYILQSCNKYYARFLTKKITDVIPRTGINGWKGKESFLFEMAYDRKLLSLKFVISPGLKHNVDLLSKVLRSIPNAKEARGEVWITHYSSSIKVNFTQEKFNNDESVANIVKELLQLNKTQIELAETAILENKDLFIY